MSKTNGMRHIEWQETWKGEWILDSSVCNNEKHWNKDKCSYECKELIDEGVCNKNFIWIPSNYESECDEMCDIGWYLDYESRK